MLSWAAIIIVPQDYIILLSFFVVPFNIFSFLGISKKSSSFLFQTSAKWIRAAKLDFWNHSSTDYRCGNSSSSFLCLDKVDLF